MQITIFLNHLIININNTNNKKFKLKINLISFIFKINNHNNYKNNKMLK